LYPLQDAPGCAPPAYNRMLLEREKPRESKSKGERPGERLSREGVVRVRGECGEKERVRERESERSSEQERERKDLKGGRGEVRDHARIPGDTAVVHTKRELADGNGTEAWRTGGRRPTSRFSW
jgi:hypothetical protein